MFPTIMIPAAGYKHPGHWDVTPNTEENGISGDVTYTYIFGKKHHSSAGRNKDKDNNKENNKENNKDNNTGETTPTKGSRFAQRQQSFCLCCRL